jgi:hypothetical protein
VPNRPQFSKRIVSVRNTLSLSLTFCKGPETLVDRLFGRVALFVISTMIYFSYYLEKRERASSRHVWVNLSPPSLRGQMCWPPAIYI